MRRMGKKVFLALVAQKTILFCDDHAGCAFCAYAWQFYICASFLQKTCLLHQKK